MLESLQQISQNEACTPCQIENVARTDLSYFLPEVHEEANVFLTSLFQFKANTS
jgi:hypothetical protein